MVQRFCLARHHASLDWQQVRLALSVRGSAALKNNSMAMLNADLPPPPTPPDRRRLTLLYSDLSGSTALSGVMEPEDYRALLQALREIWHDAAKALQGRVVLTQGDGALLVFGLPMTGEHDGRHAVEAALQIHGRVEALQPVGVPAARLPLRMHSSVHAGTLLLSDGDIERGVYDLSGDVFNTTVAGVRCAGPGEIVTTLAALGRHAMFYRLADAATGADLAAGPALHGRLLLVQGRSDVTQRFDAAARRRQTPFVGRASLLRTLQAFVASDDQQPLGQRCMVLQGGAGLGKTRVLEHLLRHHADSALLVLRGSCERELRAEVLQPFMQMLRTWHQQAAATGPASAEAPPGQLAAKARALLDMLQPGGAETPAPAGVLDRLLEFFSTLARAGPCLLVIDDWQWADDATRQLLQRLRVLAQGPRLLLASRGRDNGDDWLDGVAQLTLDAFTPEETAQTVQGLLQRPDPFLVARIHDYAGGVPLFIEELCHSVSADQVLRAIEGLGASKGWLATLVVARLERLPADQAAVVRAAAVVGNVVPLRWLAVACGGEPDSAALQALVDADFLRSDGEDGLLRFKHGITRDAVYESIGLRTRMALHQRLQLAMQGATAGDAGAEGLEALAYHSRCAGSWAQAAQHAEQAGDKAMALFALDRARQQYLAAMESLERQGPLTGETALRWCLLSNKLGMTCIFDTLALPDALPLFQRALDLANGSGDLAAQARAHYWLGYMLYGHGVPRAAQQHCRQGLNLALQADDRRLAAQLEATLGQVLVALCKYEESMQLMAGALSSKRDQARPPRQGSSLAVGSAFTLACKGSVLGDMGRFDAAHAAFDEALALVGDTAHPVANSVRSWSVMVLLWQGRWDDALAVADESIWLAQRSSALLQMTIARAAQGYALWRGQQAPRGLVQIEEAVQWMAQRRVHFYTTLYHGWLVEGLVEQQRLAAAREHAAALFGRARAGELLGLGTGCRALVLADLATGDHRRAWRRLQLAEQVAARRGARPDQALNQLCQARLLDAQGQRLQSVAMAEAAAAALRAMAMHWHADQAEAWLAQRG